jgi:ribosomal protein S5
VQVTKGGKVETLHAIVAVGNLDGVIGIGEHSGKNIQKVVMDAQFKAYRNLVPIPRYRSVQQQQQQQEHYAYCRGGWVF